MPADDFTTFKERITPLIEKYEHLVSKGEESEYNEEEVKLKFVNPFLEALGWDVKSEEVKPEKRTLMGVTDFSLKALPKKNPDIFYELKSFKESLDGYRIVAGKKQTYAMQAINAAFSARVDWCVLTNFKELRLYYSNVRKAEEGLQFTLKYKDYLSEKGFAKLYDLAKERIAKGILETYKIRRTREDVSTEFVNDLFKMRTDLAQNMKQNNNLSKEELRESVQRILDRFVVIRVAEDRGVIHTDSLSRMVQAWNDTAINKTFRTLMKDLKNLFRDFDFNYNSKLFDEHPCEDLKIDNDCIGNCIQILYNYNFDLIDADILGAMYEDYIGHILEEKKADLGIVEDYATRKKEGIYYTPIPVVEFLVTKATKEALENCENINDVKKIKIVDPACGSGSFLIKIFGEFEQHYNQYNLRKTNEIKRKGGSVSLSHFQGLIPHIKNKVLTDNIFGVDNDPQATEIAAVNLLLKTLTLGEKLPLILDKNIKCGNSLVSDSAYDTNALNWDTEFKEIMDAGGFDIVIGNPPWGADLSKWKDYLETKYDLAKGQYDSYELFIELSKKILRKDGVWGFVIPDSIFRPEHMRLRQFLSTNMKILCLVKLGEGFFDVFRASAIIIFQKTKANENHMVKALTLMKEDRKRVIEGEIDLLRLEEEKAILIPQSRFSDDPQFAFNIVQGSMDIEIMSSMENDNLDWEMLTETRRGVEFSETGRVIQCPNCFKWDSPPRKRKGVYDKKTCSHCSYMYAFENALTTENIVYDERKKDSDVRFVKGEGINRYYITDAKFLDKEKDGINYKETALYEGTKLFVRKTGVGIYATIDYDTLYVPQVVFVFKKKENVPQEYTQIRLEYILGLLNSRLMLYYYFKKFGELEWQSFPYVTQKTLKQLPLRKIDFADAEEKRLHDEIVQKVIAILAQSKEREVPKKLDYEIEDLVMKLYKITPEMKQHVWNELKKVQRLRIIRDTIG